MLSITVSGPLLWIALPDEPLEVLKPMKLDSTVSGPLLWIPGPLSKRSLCSMADTTAA